MPRLVRILLLALLILPAGAFAFWQVERLNAAVSADQSRPPRPGRAREASTSVTTVLPQETTIAPVSPVYGQVQAPIRVEVTPAVSGEVAFVMEGLRDGAHVSGGDLLLRLDDTEAVLDLRAAEAGLASAGASLQERERNIIEAEETLAFQQELLALKEADLERTTALITKGTYSPSLLETSKAALLAARQSLTQARATLAANRDLVSQGQIAVEQAELAVERARKSVAEHRVITPISGTFSGDTPIPGQQLSENALGTITDLEQLEIRLELTQAALTRITGPDGDIRSLAIEATRPGVGIAAQGVLDRLTIAEAADETDQSIAIARITEAGAARLRPGDFVEVHIHEPEMADLLSLPASAVLPGDDVLAVTDGTLERLPVSVLRRQDETVLLASKALAGQQIVLLPSGEMDSGMQVVATPLGAE